MDDVPSPLSCSPPMCHMLANLLEWHESGSNPHVDVDALSCPAAQLHRDLADGLKQDRRDYHITLPFLAGTPEAIQFISLLSQSHSSLGPDTCWYLTCNCGQSTHMIRSIKYKLSRHRVLRRVVSPSSPSPQ